MKGPFSWLGLRNWAKLANISSAILQRRATFTDGMKSLLRYIRALEELCGVPFFTVRITDVVCYMMTSNYLAGSSRAAYIRHIRSRLVMTNKKQYFLLIDLRKDALVAKTLGITLLSKPILCISFKQGILFMNQAADAFVKNERQPASFHANAFYRYTIVPLNEFCIPSLDQRQDRIPKLVQFLETQLHQKKSISY